jgi:hypothetical protein
MHIENLTYRLFDVRHAVLLMWLQKILKLLKGS